MDQFEERLRSGFQAGYVATMENPGFGNAYRHFESPAEKENNKNRNLVIDNDAINYVALRNWMKTFAYYKGALNSSVLHPRTTD